MVEQTVQFIAIAALFVTYWRRFVARVSWLGSDAEDAVQSAFVKALRAEYDPRYSLKAWVWKIVQNEANDCHRKSRRRARRMVAQAGALDALLTYPDLDAPECLRTAVECLPDSKEKRVVQLLLDGVTPGEIGRSLGLRPSQVSKLKVKACRALRCLLAAP